MAYYTAYASYLPAYALNEMLRSYVPSVQNRVYPPGTRQDSRMPRIDIDELSPVEDRVGLGEGWGSYKGIYYDYIFRVNIWDKDPNQIKTVAGEVLYSIFKHRDYVPASPNDTHGKFINLTANGGSAVTFNAGKQIYQKTINVSGRWLSMTQENWV